MKYKQIAKTTELVAGIENATQLVTIQVFTNSVGEDGTERLIDDQTLETLRFAVADAAARAGFEIRAIAAFAKLAPIELADGEKARAKCVVTLERGA